MAIRKILNPNELLIVFKQLGINKDKIVKQMHQVWVKKEIDSNLIDFKQYGSQTPTFIISDSASHKTIVLHGEQSMRQFKEAIGRTHVYS